MDKHINEVTSAGISTATDSEPDFGNWLGAGKIRKLGAETVSYTHLTLPTILRV